MLFRSFEMQADTPGVVSFIMTRIKSPPQGAFGGEAGQVGRLLLNDKPIDPSDHWVLKKGDRVLMETAGGGGYGKPAGA